MTLSKKCFSTTSLNSVMDVKFKKLENKKLEKDFDYHAVSGLRIEAKQKLNLYRPVSIGQASRISGVSPADISYKKCFSTTSLNSVMDVKFIDLFHVISN